MERVAAIGVHQRVGRNVTCALVLLAGVLQSRPDFSGRWVLDSPAPPAPEVARVLVVDQPIERANARGEPVSPAFPRISIRREGASGATSETHEIGIIGGVVDGVAVGAARTRGPSSRYETVWRGDALVFLTSRHGPDGPQTGDWSARRESWSLDSAGRLQVEIVSEAHDRPSQTSVWLYRREEQPKAGS